MKSNSQMRGRVSLPKKPLMAVYRVQCLRDGRGPWRPGLTDLWRDHDVAVPPTWMHEFPGLNLQIGWYYGSACPTPDDLALWFTSAELARLYDLGFRAVCLPDCEIVAESASQVVFRRRVPHLSGARVIDLGVIPPQEARSR